MLSHLLIFAFVDFALDSDPKNHYEDQCQGAYSLMISFRSFMVLALIFVGVISLLFFKFLYYVDI